MSSRRTLRSRILSHWGTVGDRVTHPFRNDLRRLSMRGKTRTILLTYGGGVVFPALAVLLRRLLDPWLGAPLPLATLYGAVAIAVWLGGYRPALLAAVLGYLACDWLFIEPRGAFGLGIARD